MLSRPPSHSHQATQPFSPGHQVILTRPPSHSHQAAQSFSPSHAVNLLNPPWEKMTFQGGYGIIIWYWHGAQNETTSCLPILNQLLDYLSCNILWKSTISVGSFPLCLHHWALNGPRTVNGPQTVYPDAYIHLKHCYAANNSPETGVNILVLVQKLEDGK